jgi:hypothetical protein
MKSKIEWSEQRRRLEYESKNKPGKIDWVGCIVDYPGLQEAVTQVEVFQQVKIEGCGYQLSKEALTMRLDSLEELSL